MHLCTKAVTGHLVDAVIAEAVIGYILSNLASVHHRAWNLYWATEAVVSVALMVGRLLNFCFRQIACVNHDLIVHGQGCGDGVLICDHVEVERVSSILFDDGFVNYCAGARIYNITIGLFEESRGYFPVHEYVEHFRVVSRCEPFDGLAKRSSWSFEFEAFLGKGWPTDAISVHDDLLWLLALVLLNVVLEGRLHELGQDVCSIFAVALLLLGFRLGCLGLLRIKGLICYCAIVLGQILTV
jgi:hypothetical protein